MKEINKQGYREKSSFKQGNNTGGGGGSSSQKGNEANMTNGSSGAAKSKIQIPSKHIESSEHQGEMETDRN